MYIYLCVYIHIYIYIYIYMYIYTYMYIGDVVQPPPRARSGGGEEGGDVYQRDSKRGHTNVMLGQYVETE